MSLQPLAHDRKVLKKQVYCSSLSTLTSASGKLSTNPARIPRFFSGVCLIYTLLLPPDGLITINKYQYKDIRYYFEFLQSYILTWVGVSKGFRPTSWAPSWPLIVKSSFPMQFSVSERPIYYSKMVVKRSGTNSTEYCDCYVFISSKLCL